MDYEALARKYGGKPEDGPDLEAVARKFGGRVDGEPLSPMEGAQALATGFNRSALTAIPGLPVKAALDVADLARAGYGVVGNKLGLLRPDQMPEPVDRSRFVGSPEWIANQIGATQTGAQMIENPRPDNRAARLLNAGGGAVGAAVSGSPRDAALQFASGLAGQTAIEAGASPEWAIVASMTPQAASVAGPEALRRAARGGEQGRREMAQRVQDFKNAGVDPTVGLATGGRGAQAIEAALAKVPGGAGVMARKVDSMRDQMQGAANAARDSVSPVYGPAAAGEAIKEGVTGYRARQQSVYGLMQDRALDMVPEGMRFPVNSTLAKGSQTLAEIPGAPNVSREINSPLGLTQRVMGALESDAMPQPPGAVPSAIVQQSGAPFMRPTPGNPGGLPFEGIKELKGRIGQAAYQSNPLLTDANTGALKHLYSGAKQDLRNAGVLADAERIAQGQLPGVARQLERADKFYSKTQDVLEKVLAPIYKAGDPASERSYLRIEADAASSGVAAQKLMASMPATVRKQVTATAIDRLGRASPGQQNAEGSMFSPQTFLTNWNRVTPQARDALFIGSRDVRTKLDSIAKASEMMRDANKVYANPSGTAGAANATGAITGLAGGLYGIASGNPVAGAAAMGTVLGSMAAANGGARLMTNPKFVNWLAQATVVPEARIRQHLTRLAVTAGGEKDPEAQADLGAFIRELDSEIAALGR